MENSQTAKEHVTGIFKEYTTPSRVLRSFTNLSNTVIQTALSGQNKFIFEILQNADDAYEEQQTAIEIKFILHDSYLIVHHNGKGFDHNDVERICDYASQIEEVKANDLSKTGYKGLGFKSLFNLSDCIYICSNGYSFRFDKSYWPDPDSKPWQVIPIWSVKNELPFHEKYSHDQHVNIILKVNNVKLLESQLEELIDQPDLLLFLHRINKMSICIKGKEFCLERRIDGFGDFNKINFYKNQQIISSWLTRTFHQSVPNNVKKLIEGASQFIYPEKIKRASEVPFTFAIKCKSSFEELLKINGLCFSTLPTQLHLSLPYHINSSFILNLDRTQLHENEWNGFLIKSVGCLQLSLLRDLAETKHLKNYVIEFLVRKISHQFSAFCKVFLESFNATKHVIGWLPCYEGSCLLKLGEAWTDDIEFFNQKFESIHDDQICPYLIDYDVKNRNLLSSDGEAKHFTYEKLLDNFPAKYRHQLSKNSYLNFISYLHERIQLYTSASNKLKSVPFLKAKDGTYISPANALLENNECPIADFFMLNPVDNDYLPTQKHSYIKSWLTNLGAFNLTSPVQIVQKSVLKWIQNGTLRRNVTLNNHDQIITFLAHHVKSFTRNEINTLKDNFIVLTEDNQFRLANKCFVPDATTIEELADVISDSDKISSSYNMVSLREFFVEIGVHDRLSAIDVLNRSILSWIKDGIINSKLTLWNYHPIIKFFAMHYPEMAYKLMSDQKTGLKKMPVLTCDQTLKEAQACYFPSALPACKELQYVIAQNELAFTEKVPENITEFLKEIGVSAYMSPSEVLRRSVLKWLQENKALEKITKDNHDAILSYISHVFDTISVNLNETELLKKIPVLTKSNTFRAACDCYWSLNISSTIFYDKTSIPGVDQVIPLDMLISDHYFATQNKDKEKFVSLFKHLGVKHLKFAEISKKYCDYLSVSENAKWFFSELKSYWQTNSCNNNQLLLYIKKKFNSSSSLLAQNHKMYSSASLYSSKFVEMSEIDRDTVPTLDYGDLPEDLEDFLGFKNQLELACIVKLLEAVSKNPILGDSAFFKIILQQLKNKSMKDIESYQLSLLSEENIMIPAKNLHYFQEANATCILRSCYLKRVNGMSREETLELAKQCGVNLWPFSEEIQKVEGRCDNSLKEFYLHRLPFIVFQESKKLNKSHSTVLKDLYDRISSIELFECKQMHLKYPFGEPTKVHCHLNELNIYVTSKWNKKKSTIHDHLKQEFKFHTDIKDIIDMDPFDQHDKEEFLESLSKEDRLVFKMIEEELLTISGKRIPEVSVVPYIKPREDNDYRNFKEQLHLNVVQPQWEVSTLQTHYRKRPGCKRSRRQFRNRTTVQISEVVSISSSEDYQVEEPESDTEISHYRRLSEEYVFTYLQNYYKNKHPCMRIQLGDGFFTIGEGSSLIEISLLEEKNKDKHSCSIVLKKGGEIDELIKVEMSSIQEDDAFQISCCEFLDKMSQLHNTSFYQYKERFQIYYIFCSNDFTVLSDELENPVLYKISPLKI